MSNPSLKAYVGDMVYLLLPVKNVVGPYRVFGPLCVTKIQITEAFVSYRVRGNDEDGNAYPWVTDELLFTDKEAAVDEAREMNTGFKNERVLIARTNWLWVQLTSRGNVTDDWVLENMPENAKDDVTSRTLGIENPVEGVSMDAQHAVEGP